MDLIRLYFLSVALLVLGGFVCYLLRFGKQKIAGPLATLCTLAALVLGARLAWLARGVTPELDFGQFVLWTGLSAQFVFRITPLTGIVNTLCLLFGFCVVLYSLSYWRTTREDVRFYAFALWAVAGASVALATRNLLVFLFAWEVVTLMLYLLVGISGPKARAGAAKTFSMLGFSDVALILAIALLFARGGWAMLNIDHLQDASHLGGRIAVAGWADVGLFCLFLIAALTKAGAVPLHTWVPSASEEAPMPTMALLPASLDKLLGIMLLLRISFGFFELSQGLRLLLMAIGVVTLLAAVMMALVQQTLRRLLAYDAVSQVGYMVLGVGTGVPIGVVGAVFHMINHTVYKTLLFLAGGAVESRTGETSLDNLGGLAGAMPLTTGAFMVGAFAVSGVPPLNGFVSKWMVYQGIIEGGGPLMPILLAGGVLGSGLTLALFVKAMHSVFFGERSTALKGREVTGVGWNMLFPMGVLSFLCVFLGILGGYMVRSLLSALSAEFGIAAPGVQAASAVTSDLGFWGPPQAVGLIILGLVLGVLFYAFGRTMRVRRVRSFLAGEVDPPKPTHVSGTSFYLTVRDLPVLRGLYGDAEQGAFDLYRIAGLVGSRIVEGLRKLHTGVLEVYVTWVVVGVAAVIALLFLLR
ncbi:MAG: proton-conducting transporter membrane subunit [Candidatus Brocadiaceae bacterium]|jgi:formate hydrogenlyase subunit 3/multisubunit Na+/H+ antiporter MnhD subunit